MKLSVRVLTATDDYPMRAVANVIGNINGQEFGVSTISADIHRDDTATRINATLTNVPPNISIYLIYSFRQMTATEIYRVRQNKVAAKHLRKLQ